ncbi:MAG: hypothetical protein GPJ34_10085 [Microcystis aeruginosa LL11-07]|jgi:hypothetical protein|nr:hypothetical protein [Microcystis aeruginosa LL11-07]
MGVADLRYESSFVGFLKPRPKLTFGWVQDCHSYLDSATPTTGIDPQTGEEVAIFNPRLQLWNDHFVWINKGLIIIGTTPTGRATCVRLDFNDQFHNQGFIQESRQLWIKGGWHPPQEDLCLKSRLFPNF